MSSRKRRPAEKSAIVPPGGGPVVAAAVEDRPDPGRKPYWWMIALAVVLALVVAFEIYGPALHGEFLFDDEYLPFLMPDVQNAPLDKWLGVRPLLMVSYG